MYCNCRCRCRCNGRRYDSAFTMTDYYGRRRYDRYDDEFTNGRRLDNEFDYRQGYDDDYLRGEVYSNEYSYARGINNELEHTRSYDNEFKRGFRRCRWVV